MQMTDRELLEILPQFFGILFALILIGSLTEHTFLYYVALAVLFGLIFKLRLLLLAGRFLRDVLHFIGQAITYTALGAIYVFFVIPYALFFRLVEKKTVTIFFPEATTRTSFVETKNTYNKEYFERPW